MNRSEFGIIIRNQIVSTSKYERLTNLQFTTISSCVFQDAVTIASKKKEEGSSKSIHASILSKINLNNNQKAGLSFAPRHSQKVRAL